MIPDTSFPIMWLANEYGVPYDIMCRYAESQMFIGKSTMSRHYSGWTCFQVVKEMKEYCSAQIFLSVNEDLDEVRRRLNP